VRWYRKAADQGNAAAQYNLGFHYDNGQGVEEDQAEAVRWYLKAAEQGLADAQYSLGVMYFNDGEGLEEDHAEAARWFRLAADQGDADAAAELEKVLRAGISSVDTAIPTISEGVSMRVCSNCGIAAAEGSGGIALKPCSRCKAVVYCGKKCQTQHWKSGGHKAACKQS
jgi:TPR repeat protein